MSRLPAVDGLFHFKDRIQHLKEYTGSKPRNSLIPLLILVGCLLSWDSFSAQEWTFFPQEYTDELAKLQDSVEPVDTAHIRERIEQELTLWR